MLTLSVLVAGGLMGVIMYAVMGIMQTVAGLYTLESTVAGWTPHSVIIALPFGVAFAGPPLEQYRTEILSRMSLGIIWGVVL
ncbi:hypothetical protein [Natranaeroarchaeum sulfidigenes]|nr:hypothetical protein [Natranaeroarchaeum sulfidigenes]